MAAIACSGASAFQVQGVRRSWQGQEPARQKWRNTCEDRAVLWSATRWSLFSGATRLERLKLGLAKRRDECNVENDDIDAVVTARVRLVDELLAQVWAGKDGFCASDAEEADIDAIAGEL